MSTCVSAQAVSSPYVIWVFMSAVFFRSVVAEIPALKISAYNNNKKKKKYAPLTLVDVTD